MRSLCGYRSSTTWTIAHAFLECDVNNAPIIFHTAYMRGSMYVNGGVYVCVHVYAQQVLAWPA